MLKSLQTTKGDDKDNGKLIYDKKSSKFDLNKPEVCTM